jgi:tetratricopeptide (TPR) repeat protein
VRADDAAAMIGMGRLAYLNGDPAVAHAWAERILARDPKHIDALLFKAELLRAQDKGQQAFEIYDKVLALQPQHRSAHVEKAYTAIGLQRYDMAQAELDAALKLAPGSVLVAYTQALLDFSRGRIQESHDALLKVLRVAPEHMPSVLLAGVVNLQARLLLPGRAPLPPLPGAQSRAPVCPQDAGTACWAAAMARKRWKRSSRAEESAGGG